MKGLAADIGSRGMRGSATSWLNGGIWLLMRYSRCGGGCTYSGPGRFESGDLVL
jgi:hypothetical protein